MMLFQKVKEGFKKAKETLEKPEQESLLSSKKSKQNYSSIGGDALEYKGDKTDAYRPISSGSRPK